MQLDFFRVGGSEFFGVPSLSVSHIYFTGSGVVGDMFLKRRDFCHARLCRLYFLAKLGELVFRVFQRGGQVTVRKKFVFGEIGKRLSHLFHVEVSRPAFVSRTFSFPQLGVYIHKQTGFLRSGGNGFSFSR